MILSPSSSSTESPTHISIPNSRLINLTHGRHFDFLFNPGLNDQTLNPYNYNERHGFSWNAGWNEAPNTPFVMGGGSQFDSFPVTCSFSSPSFYLGNPWTVHHCLFVQSMVTSRSISQAVSVVQTALHVGDVGNYLYQNFRAGTIGGSDEGTKGWVVNQTELPAPSGTIVQGGANATVIRSNFTSNGGNQGDAGDLLSTSPSDTMASGIITAITTNPLQGLTLNTITTSDAHPVSTGYGLLVSACGRSTVRSMPQSASCTATLKAGAFSAAAGSTVCVGDYRNPEQAAITAAGPAGATQALTLALTYSHPAGTQVYQGGLCGAKIVPGFGSLTPLAAPNGVMTTLFAAGSRTPNSIDFVHVYKTGQNGNLSYHLPNLVPEGPTFPVLSARREGGRVSLNVGYSLAVLNQMTLPGGVTLTLSGVTPSSFNGRISGPLTSRGGDLEFSQAGPNASGKGGTLTINGYANYVAQCGAEVTKVVNSSIWYMDHPGPSGSPAGDGSLAVEANNCKWPVGGGVIQPNFYEQYTEGEEVNSLWLTPALQNPNTQSERSMQGAGTSGASYFTMGSGDPLSAYADFGGTQIAHTLFALNDFYNLGIHMAHAPIQGGALLAVGGLPDGSPFSNWRLLTTSFGQLQVDEAARNLSFEGIKLRAAAGLSADQYAILPANTTVNGRNPCLQDGTNCPGSLLVSSVVTTNARSDTVPLKGMLAGGHCSQPGATNALAGSATGVWITKGNGVVTLFHPPVAGMTFDISCTPY